MSLSRGVPRCHHPSLLRKETLLFTRLTCLLPHAGRRLPFAPALSKKKKERALGSARRVGSVSRIPLCQWNRSYARKKKKKILPRWASACSARGFIREPWKFYVKSQIQVVFPIARQTPGPVTRGQRPTFRDHNSLRLSSARKHRRPSAGPRWKVSGRQTTQISSVSEKDKV